MKKIHDKKMFLDYRVTATDTNSGQSTGTGASVLMVCNLFVFKPIGEEWTFSILIIWMSSHSFLGALGGNFHFYFLFSKKILIGKQNSPRLDAAFNQNSNQRTNGPVNAHLISWPSKAQNIQNLENIW